jgi:toxin CptA
MSSPPFDATIDLALRPSLRALAWLFGIHAALLALALVAVPRGAPMAAMAVAVAASWLWTRRHAAFGHGARALSRLTWHADGSWLVHDAAGARHEAELLGSSLVHEQLLVLNFRLAGGARRSRAVLGDEADEESLRRLRARLALKQRRPGRIVGRATAPVCG